MWVDHNGDRPLQQCPLQDTREYRTNVLEYERAASVVTKSGASMMFRPERCIVVVVATAILHNGDCLCQTTTSELTRKKTTTMKGMMSIGRITAMTALSQDMT